MTPDQRVQHERAQLLRLRQLREDAARALREARARERDAALAAVRAREAEIVRLKAAIAALSAFVVGEGAPSLPRLAPVSSARRALLDDLLERAEYGLIDDEEALHEAEQALARAQAGYLQAGLQRQAAEALQADARKALHRAREARLERDTEHRTPAAGPWAPPGANRLYD